MLLNIYTDKDDNDDTWSPEGVVIPAELQALQVRTELGQAGQVTGVM